MDSLSHNILSVLPPFSVLFSRLSWKKALALLLGTIVCTGRRTVCSALRAMGLCNQVNFSKFHHLLNRTQWSLLCAAKILLLILRKGEKMPSGENITHEMIEWAEALLKRVLQAA